MEVKLVPNLKKGNVVWHILYMNQALSEARRTAPTYSGLVADSSAETTAKNQEDASRATMEWL